MWFSPAFLLFSLMIGSSLLFVASSSSLLMCWVGLELNTAGFIPFILSENSKGLSDSCIKYFLTQALASVFFLLSVVLLIIFDSVEAFGYSLLLVSLLIKLGAAPFHSWLISLVESLDWLVLFILLTIQKINPLLILVNYNNKMDLVWIIVCVSVLVGSLGGLSQVRLRKIISLSSINHLGWLLAAINLNLKFLVVYFVSYVFLLASLISIFMKLNLFQLTQLSSVNLGMSNLNLIFLNLLSLGGLPPFFGFFPKWIVLEGLSVGNFFLVILVMIVSSLVVLYFYLRLSFSAFILKNLSWGQFHIKNNLSVGSAFLSLFSLGGLSVVYLI